MDLKEAQQGKGPLAGAEIDDIFAEVAQYQIGCRALRSPVSTTQSHHALARITLETFFKSYIS